MCCLSEGRIGYHRFFSLQNGSENGSILLGFRDKSKYSLVTVTTEDASEGPKGIITALLEKLLKDPPEMVYTYGMMAKELSDTNVDMIELNISCSNVECGRVQVGAALFQDSYAPTKNCEGITWFLDRKGVISVKELTGSLKIW